jgi:hypothetical protein
MTKAVRNPVNAPVGVDEVAHYGATGTGVIDTSMAPKRSAYVGPNSGVDIRGLVKPKPYVYRPSMLMLGLSFLADL